MLTSLRLRTNAGAVRVWAGVQGQAHEQVCRQGYSRFYSPLNAKGWSKIWVFIREEVKDPACLSLRQEQF